MKKNVPIIAAIILAVSLFSFSGCITTRGDNLPPGQEKKITGEKDASDLAPGHNK